MSKKSTKTEMIEREDRIVALIGQGMSRKAIGDLIASEYGCTPLAACKQYDNLIKEIQVVTTQERETTRSVLLQRYEHLYREALSRGNYKTASDVLDKQAKLLGLYDRDAVKEEAPKIVIKGKPDLKVVPEGTEDAS